MHSKVKILRIEIDGMIVGRMVLSSRNLCVFEYDSEFISKGFSISPFYLPLRSGVFTAKRDPFNGLFGVFNDSLPDGWGQLLLDRYLQKKGVKLQALSVLDRLSIVGSAGMGSINYMPDNHIKSSDNAMDLDFMAMEVKKIISNDKYIDSIDEIVAKAGSSGGARPKVFIDYKGEPWIVKFPSSMDVSNIGEIEYNYSLIARKCGIEMTETELVEGKYFGIKRFDREGDKRIHFHSVSGLLYASHRFSSLDYIDLIKATYSLTKSMKEVGKMYRQMVFNILTGNKDDHSKNFAFIYKNNEWKLSPAYDLVPSIGINDNHTTTINGEGNPKLSDIYKVAKLSGINDSVAKAIFEEVYSASKEIRTWGS